MATVESANPAPAPEADKNKGQTIAHGIPTPDATPDVDDARIAADAARRAGATSDTAGESKSEGTPQSDEGGSDDKPKGGKLPDEQQNKDGDLDMGGLEKSLEEEVLEIYNACAPIVGGLMTTSDISAHLKALEDANTALKEASRKYNAPENRHLIDTDTFVALFREAFPHWQRLQENPADGEARSKIEAVNINLEKLIKEHNYPSDWILKTPELPKTTVQPKPPRDPSETLESQTAKRTLPAQTNKFLTVEERTGYVLDQGVEKEVIGYRKAGPGHQLLLRTDGRNNLDIYELVRASKFGKKYVQHHKETLQGLEIAIGKRETLKAKNFEKAQFGGVASVQRNEKNKPEGGWERETVTIINLRFPKSPTFTWYRRGDLGMEFGQELVDERANLYRRRAGQNRPIAPAKRGTRKKRTVASDDEDEGSIPLGDEDTDSDDNTTDKGSDDQEDEEQEDEEEDIDAKMEKLAALMESLKKEKRATRRVPPPTTPAASKKSRSKKKR